MDYGKRTNRLALYAQLLAKYGEQRQIDKAIEEFGELIQALQKFKYGETTSEHVAEEVWDAASGLEQIMFLLGIEPEVMRWMYYKTERTAERLEKGDCPDGKTQ